MLFLPLSPGAGGAPARANSNVSRSLGFLISDLESGHCCLHFRSSAEGSEAPPVFSSDPQFPDAVCLRVCRHHHVPDLVRLQAGPEPVSHRRESQGRVGPTPCLFPPLGVRLPVECLRGGVWLASPSTVCGWACASECIVALESESWRIIFMLLKKRILLTSSLLPVDGFIDKILMLLPRQLLEMNRNTAICLIMPAMPRVVWCASKKRGEPVVPRSHARAERGDPVTTRTR